MADIVMPRLSDSMEEGTILEWLVESGDTVEVGQTIVEIETDKATMEYESDLAGQITLIASPGDTVPVGETIATVSPSGQAAEEKPAALGEEPAPSEEAPAPKVEEPAPLPDTTEQVQEIPTQQVSRPKASPIAKRMAKSAGIDIATLSGSGPGGRVVKKDVEAALQESAKEAPAPAPAAQQAKQAEPASAGAETIELTRIEEIGARRMSESKATIPHFYLQRTVDVTELVRSRENLRGKVDPLPSLNDFLIKICAKALLDHPRLRSRYADGRAEVRPSIDIGVAAATDQGLMVPVVAGADKRSVSEICLRSRELAERAREGTITPPELSGAVFTVSNLGMYGVDSFSAIITPGQSAILAVGAAKEVAAVYEGRVEPRWHMSLQLSCDHRIVDGAAGALFLDDIAVGLQNPFAALI